MSAATPYGHRLRPGVGDLVRLAWRLGGRVVAPVTTPAPERARSVVSVRAGVPAGAHEASDRVLVLVPRSGGDERTWERGVESTGATYGDRLAALLDWSPVSLRYDAGAGPAAGALALSALLQRLVETWPVPVTRLVLVAEGDGGLLARAALGVRQPGRQSWTDRVTELVALGTPSLGTPAAAGAHTPGYGRRLEEELGGIVEVTPEQLDLPPLDHVRYVVVADRAATRPSPVGRALGGLLRWRRSSRRVHDLFPSAERFEVRTGGRPLVNHPEVHEALLHRLA